jgi:hypothetical protein
VKKVIKGDTVLHNAIRFAKVAKILDIPIVSGRQAKSGGAICSQLEA